MAGAPTLSVSQRRLGPDEDDGRAVKEELNPHTCHPECSVSGFQVVCVPVSLNTKESFGPELRSSIQIPATWNLYQSISQSSIYLFIIHLFLSIYLHMGTCA